MTIRTFRAPTVGEALAQVKKDLGSGAVILHTRTYKVGGVLGVGARTITEITATTDMHLAPRPAPRSAATLARPKAEPTAQAVGPKPAATRKPAALQAPSEQQLPAQPPLTNAPRLATTVLAAQAPASPAPRTNQDHYLRPHVPDQSLTTQIRDEMAMLRKLVARMAVSSAPAAPVTPGAMPDALATCYLRLIESEVASEIADEVVASLREQLSPAHLADPEHVRRAALARLARYIPAAETPASPAANTPPPRPRDGRPLTIALIGPTGVGKTTTIAKLAATYKLRLGQRVGLITADTYRIAAVDQLRTYAGIIGLPLKVVLTPGEMRSACDSLRDCDIILLDTAGRAPSDAGRLSELSSFLDAAVPHQTHLVLSSAASEACMRQAAQAFANVGPTHLIFTKLDEAVSFGVLINIVRHVNAKLSFVTTGQEVPDHIEHASAPRLAGLILEGGAVR
ncbi:MAG: flagellar biosynthesis protein FlhF [Phycisphaerales bacterium]